MLDKIFAHVFRRQLIKKSTSTLVEHQQHVEKYYKERQKQKEKRWDDQGERAIYHAYLPMASYYASAAVGWKYLMGFMVICLVGILLYILGFSIWEYGFVSTFNGFKEMMAAFRWYDGVAFVFCILFFAGLFAVSPILIKYVENTETIFTNRCVYIKRYLRKDKIVTYEEIKECIERRKICIKNGRYIIPCKGGSIPVEIATGEFPAELFALLQKKCNILLPGWDINHRAQRSGVGWACGTLGGGIAAVFAMFIWGIIFLSEGVFTWERAVFDFFVNPMMWFVVGLVTLGLLFRIYFFPSTLLAYRKYKKVIKVSVMPIFVDMLVVWVLAGGYMHYNATVIPEEQAVVEGEVNRELVQEFCEDVWGKQYNQITDEELESVKYISLDVEGYGRATIKYSMQDYATSSDEKEFQESIETWQVDTGEYIMYPLDFRMFTGLTYVDATDGMEDFWLPGEGAITRFDLGRPPADYLGLIDESTVEVLNVECYDSENAFDGLEAFTNLTDLTYINSAYQGNADLRVFENLHNLRNIHLECGETYSNLEVLSNSTQLESIYIDKATLSQCEFVKDIPTLNALFVRYGEDGDLSVLANLPNLWTLWFLDNEVVDVSGLSQLENVHELRVTVADQEGVDAIADMGLPLSVLNLRIDDWSYWGYGKAYDISEFAEMVNLKELNVVMDGMFDLSGVEALLGTSHLKTLSLRGGYYGPETVLYVDSAQLDENYGIETLTLGECLIRDIETNESLTDAFLSQFKGVKKLSLIGYRQGPTSYACLAECDSLTTLYMQDVTLTEENEAELKALEDTVEIIYE